MRYLSEDDLRHVTKGLDEDTESALLEKLIDLPDPQWQTIDEFKSNPVDGWCWIQHKTLKTTASYYRNIFTVDGNVFSSEYITHVMSIKTPEAPE